MFHALSRIQRSEEFPYTHPFGEIRSFSIAVLDGVTYVITAGGEGLIRTWRFDAAKGAFEQIMVLEGHLRAVTCVLLNGMTAARPPLNSNCPLNVSMVVYASIGGFLWSGSVDSTIRVWDLGSGKCAATLSAIGGGGGHTEAVSCIEFVPNAGGPEPFIATGSADKTVKLWKTSGGTLLHTCNHAAMVTALKAFRDNMGGGSPVVLCAYAHILRDLNRSQSMCLHFLTLYRHSSADRGPAGRHDRGALVRVDEGSVLAGPVDLPH